MSSSTSPKRRESSALSTSARNSGEKVAMPLKNPSFTFLLTAYSTSSRGPAPSAIYEVPARPKRRMTAASCGAGRANILIDLSRFGRGLASIKRQNSLRNSSFSSTLKGDTLVEGLFVLNKLLIQFFIVLL